MEFERVAENGNEADTGEKIGIARIRLSLPACGMTAVVSGFYEADRALAAWQDPARPVQACEYTIQFTDGVSLRGRFSSSSKRPKPPSLWRVIQVAMGVFAAAAGLQVDQALVDSHGNPMNNAMLEHYSLERS